MNIEEKEIGPEKFFNLEHPETPYIEIQFRTSKPKDPENPDSARWESVTLENNFFDQLTITDESGFQELELTLTDKDYINIEDLILRTIMTSRVEAWSGIANDSSNAQQYKEATHSLDNASKFPENPKANDPAATEAEVNQLNEANSKLQASLNENNKNTSHGVQTQQIIEANETRIKELEGNGVQAQQAKKERSDVVMKNTFQVYIDSSMASCIRVRFGWSSNKKDVYYETEDLNAFEQRTEQTAPVIRSPWLYFMMLGANYNIDSNGKMTFLIRGVSVAKAYLEKAKFLMNGTVLEGLPKDIWEIFVNSIEIANKGNIICEMPDENFFKGQNKQIKLSSLYENPMIYLDSTGNEKRSLHFKSMKQLLSDYVNLLNSKYIDYDGVEIPLRDNEIPDDSQIHHIEKPDFIVEKDNKTNKSIVKLYYRQPNVDKQTFIRVYSWKDAKNSIIKNFSISTESDFAQMNAPITIKDANGGFKQINLSSTEVGLNGMDINPNELNDLTKQINNAKGQIGFISAEIFKSGNYNGPQDFIASFIQNLNDNVFKGTIDLFLDPFYLFDSSLKPYEYLIKIDVNTPSRYTRNETYVSGSKSYLTGYYMIGKIKHTITESSATTSLEVIKFPEIRADAGRNPNIVEKKAMAEKLADLKNVEAQAQAKRDEVNRKADEVKTQREQINNTRTTLQKLETNGAAESQIKIYKDLLAQQNKELSDLEFSLDYTKEQLLDVTSRAEAMKKQYGGQ